MARELARRSLPSGRIARVVMSEAADGDVAVGDTAVGGPGRLLATGDGRSAGMLGEVPRPWTVLDQVHGAAVAVVGEPGGASGTPADAMVTDRPGVALSIQVADCVPVALLGHSSIAVAHAGWRGLVAGVLEATVAALVEADASSAVPLEAVVGPHVGSCCYEFGADDLARLVAAFGPGVAAETRNGRPALDLAAAVSGVLGRREVTATFDGVCTSCDERHWSFRATGTACRQAMLAWMEPIPQPVG